MFHMCFELQTLPVYRSIALYSTRIYDQQHNNCMNYTTITITIAIEHTFRTT